VTSLKTPVVPIANLDLTLTRRRWSFADQRRSEIEDHFSALREEKPGLWNGRVLMLHNYAVVGKTFHGDFLETDFASFIAWHDWGTPDATVKNCFSMGAIKTSDGAFLLGVMAADTANADKIYFPGGVADLQALNGTIVDLESSMWREVEEETGLTRDDLTAESLWHTVFDGPRIAHVRILHARESSRVLRERILTNIQRQEQPELADIHIVRDKTDLHPMIQPLVVAFLTSVESL
jgi:8-oxo-dGTP pyrophosphatase MutT (NUDIX family)